MNRIEQMKKVQNCALEMFRKKNADYGDAFAEFGVIGILMRIQDKIQRSLSITKNGVNLVIDENIRDTLMDLHNYAAMGVMLLDEIPNEDSFNETIGLVHGDPDHYGRTEKWTCPYCSQLVPGNMKTWGWTKCIHCNKIPSWKTNFIQTKEG